jgi:hypothetical protein
MDMPKPGDAHKKLAPLVGEWTGDETLHPSPWDPSGGGARAQVTNRWIADGFAVLQEYEQSRDGQVTFRGHGVFWFDPRTEEYVMHWWDSMGGTAGEYRGRFDGDRLVLAAPMPQGGHSRTSWLLTGPDAHDFLMEVSPDGEAWMPAMEGQYQRRQAAPARRRVTKAATKKAAKNAKKTANAKAVPRATASATRWAAPKRMAAAKSVKAARTATKRGRTAKAARRRR